MPSQSTTHEHDATDDAPGTFAAHYAPGQERPLRSYAILVGAYTSASAGALALLRARGRQLPESYSVGDVLLVGIATHKISRLIAKDKVTSFIRAPFTRFQETSGQGEVEEQPYGHGLRYAAGELLVCPFCLAQWVASGLAVGLIAAPRFTRLLSTTLVAHTISDFLQLAYKAAEERA